MGNKVYVTTPDAYLVAMDAATGNVIWESKIAEASDGCWSPAAPLAANGKIIAGIAPSDHGLNGFLDAYDAETGRRIWRWHAIPKPGEPGSETSAGDSWKHGGGDTWLTGSYDPELNLLYWGIGNPAPDFNGDVRKGDNLYTECMVALDADTGKLKWYHGLGRRRDPHPHRCAVQGPDPQASRARRRQWLLLPARPHQRQVSARLALREDAKLGRGTG